jgi:hypothetical protein
MDAARRFNLSLLEAYFIFTAVSDSIAAVLKDMEFRG